MNRTLVPRDGAGKCAAHLVKRSCVIETALPNLVHRPFRSCLVWARRIGTDGKDCPPPYTGLGSRINKPSDDTHNASIRYIWRNLPDAA